MFKIIEGLNDDVLGIEAFGKLTHDDYINKLIPLCDAFMAAQDKVKFLYVLGADFDGFELAALWDDASYGIKHWRDFSHVALVTDEKWISSTAAMLAPLFPGVLRVFSLAEIDNAKDWLNSS